jgi:TP901 family phage tail tape measure protein
MSDFESNVGLNIDVSQALTAIKTLQRQISDFHSSLAKGSATANLKSLQMQQSLIDTVNATGQYSAQMKTVASATQTFTTALEKNKLSMSQYFRYAGGASKSFGKFFTNEMDTIQKVAIERVKDLQTQYIKMGRDANGAIRSIAVRPLALDMDNLATKTQIAAQKQQLLNQLLKQGSTNLLNFGKNTQWAGRQLMVGFTIPLGIFGATAAKTFMQMEEQAIKFKRVYGDTFTATKETDAMLKQVQQLASEFTKYGVAVEKTMEQAAKAAATGKMGAELLAQVSEATRLSVLGNVEQSQALETTISLTNAFGTAADELRGKINFLNAVENQTVTSIEDLTTAIPKAAPVIKQLGGNVEDLAFFLTAMREGGINASESANALKSGLASLINPTKKASDFLQSFGININKIVEGNKGDVKGLVVDFAKALDTLDPLNRARAIEQLFGKFQFSRLSTLFQNVIKDGSQAAKVLELTRQSSAELGILAQRELNRISASPMYKFQKAIADFKKELAPVGEEFLKAVTPIIQFGTDMLKAFNNLDGGVKQFIVNATGLVAGLGPIFLMTFGLIANGVANIIKGFTFVKTVFNKASSASTVLGETTDYMTQQQIEAAAAAASLEQVHNKLTQAFTVETTAVKNLASAYQKAISAQNAFTGPPATGKGRAPKKYAAGVFSVPGPKGAGDIVPAMLSPGEAVIPAKPAQKYRGFIKSMISGNIPGFVRGTMSVGDENLDWDKLNNEEKKSILRGTRSAPEAFKKEKYDLSWSTREKEIQTITEKLKQSGMSQEQIRRYIDVHVSHIMPDKRMVKIGGMPTSVSDFRNVDKLTPDLGIMNLFTEFVKDSAKGASAKELKAVIGKSMTIKQIQEQLDALARGEHIGATAGGNKVLGAFAQQISAGKIKAGGDVTRQLAPAVAAVADIRANDKSGSGFLGGIKDRKFSRKTLDLADKQFRSKLQTAYNIAKKAIESPEYRATLRPNRKKDDKAASSAKAKNTAAVNKNTKAVKKDTAAVEKGTKAKEKTTKTQSKATPTLSVKEQLSNGITRTVGTNKNGREFEQFHITDENGKKRKISATEAQRMLSGRGATASPKGRIKGILTGLPGKLGLGGLAAMGAGAVTGNQQVSGLADQLFTAAMLSSFIPPGTMGKMKDSLGGAKDKFMKSSMGQRYAGTRMYGKFGEATEGLSKFKIGAKAEIASKGLMKSLPFLAKGATMVGLRFLNMIPIVGQVALALEVVYTVATANARAQEEISKSIVETLTMTKEKLDGLNEFFGSDAKLSGIRTLSVTGEGQSGEQATLAEQFRQSEQFKNTYKETAGKLKDASPQQFALTMQSLGVDLYGQGMSEEQVQIIIDAIKKEAGQQSVVIKFKDLRLDTETGRENLAKSLKIISDGAVKEFQSNRDFLGLNFEAQAKLDEYESQMSGFISGLSQEFEKGRISSSQFEASFGDIEAAFNKAEAANPGDGLQLLNSVLMNVSPEVAQASAAISDMSTKMLVLKLAAEGAAMSTQLLADAAVGNEKAIKHLEDLDKLEKSKNKRIRQQEKIIQGISQQQQNLQKEERNLNDTYDERIKALERINQLQEQTAKQKQNQLDLADALSRGDVFAAAQAMQKIRADQAALALEQQKNILVDEKDKKAKAIQNKADSLDDALSSARAKIGDINAEQGKEYKSEINAATIEQMYKGVPGKLWNILNWQTYFADEQTKYKEFSKYIAGDPGARGNIAGTLGFMGSLGPLNPVGTLLTSGLGIYSAVKGNKETTKAAGGYISGPGSGTSDSIPARLSNGEYVLRAKAVDALGVDTLDMLNYAEKFANGGYASSDERRSSLKSRKYKSWTPTKSNSLSVMADIKRLQEIDAQAKDLNPFNDASPEYRKQLIRNIAVYKSLYGDPASSTLSASQLKSQASSAMTKQQLGVLANDTSGVMETARFASYLTPVLGTGVAISETANSASRGDALGTALNALGVIPGIGGASKIIEKIGTKIGPSKFGSALTKTGSSGFNAYQAVNNFLPSMVGKGLSKISPSMSRLGTTIANKSAPIKDLLSTLGNRGITNSKSQREKQKDIAEQTIRSFENAIQKMYKYADENPTIKNNHSWAGETVTPFSSYYGNPDTLANALRTYAQLLAKNERYAFGSPGKMSQNTSGFFEIDRMTPEQIVNLAAGIRSSNFGGTLGSGGSYISPYQVRTRNKNYRIQAPGRIEDFLYTRGIIGPRSSTLNTLGYIQQSGTSLMPATGPFAHLFGGKQGGANVTAVGNMAGTLGKDDIKNIRRAETMLMNRLKINKDSGLSEFGVYFDPTDTSGYNFMRGPLSVYMDTASMARGESNIFAHEYQHVSDKFNKFFGGYKSTFGIPKKLYDMFKSNRPAENAIAEASAQAQSALVDKNGGFSMFYNHIPLGASNSRIPLSRLNSQMSEETLLLHALYNQSVSGTVPLLNRQHQFSADWFETYVKEILRHRTEYASKNPTKPPLPIHKDEELDVAMALAGALRKYNIDAYDDKNFVKNTLNFFQQQTSTATDEVTRGQILYIQGMFENSVSAAEKIKKGFIGQGYRPKLPIQNRQEKRFGADTRDWVYEFLYGEAKPGVSAPATIPSQMFDSSPSAGPSSVRSLTDSLTASAQVTDSYMMDLIDTSDFRKAFKEVFANRGTIGSYANPDVLGMRNLFGDFGLGGTLPAGNFSARKGMGMVASELPKRMALVEASIAAINYQKNGSGVESIATLMAMTPQWRSWQKLGVSTANYMPNLMRYGQMNPNEAVLASLAMELAQLRNTASIIPDVAFRGGRKADEFMDAVDSVMTPFDPERYLRGDDSIQILESKKFEPVNFDPKNPVFKELLAQPQDAVQEFFRTIYSGMDISKTGFRVANEALRATVVPGTNPRIGFGGSIQKLDATAPFSGLVGDFSRVMYDDKIFHDLFMIQEAFRGKGISSALSPITEELYRLFGMNRIEMIAGLESGPITWAKAGYKFNGNPQEVSNAILNKLNSPALPKEEKIALEKIYNDLQRDTISITPKDILNTSSKTNPSLGRDILYGTSYSAVKLLKDIPLNKELSRQVYGLVEQASKVSGINIMDFIPKFKNGGMFRTSYAQGGLAMLHDKEFVMNAGAVKDYGVNNLRAMNNGTYSSGSVYNSYGVNINVGGSNSNANDIARTVIREIKRLDSQNIRSTKV